MLGLKAFSPMQAGLVALALLTAPGLAQAQGSARMSISGTEYIASGGSSNSVGVLKDGVALRVGGFLVTVNGSTMKIGETSLTLPASARQVMAKANGWSLIITVDGKPLHTVSESEGIQVAGDTIDPAALNDLGVKFMRGDGVKRDPKKAIELYTKAANRGNMYSQSNLAYVYWEGTSAPRDPKKAVEWAEKAAAQGNALSMWLLGEAYSKGEGVTRDPAKGLEWYTKAAESGDAASMNNLGTLYWDGKGVPKDREKALSWYRRAMDKGSLVAVSNLGKAFRDGEGVRRDERMAELYLEAASRGGNRKATEALVELRAKMGKSSGLSTAAAEQKKYWFSENDVNIGPLTLSVLGLAIRNRRVRRDDMVWTATAKWQRARRIPEVNRLF